MQYNPLEQRCQSNVVETKCGTGSYYYNHLTQFCNENSVYDKCGGTIIYSPATEQCCGSGKYATSTEFCSSNNIYSKCGGTIIYNPATEQCCGSSKYVTSTEFCSGSSVYGKCGGTETYNPVTEQCCGSSKYVTSTEFCSGNSIYSKCGGNVYNPSIQICIENSIYSKCGNSSYNPSTQFCSGTTAYDKCGTDFANGTKREHYGMMKEQFCDLRDGKAYVYVTIGEGNTAQTWMAENLNYVASGSTCLHYKNVGESNCNIFGRLYGWVMTKTACPAGWHLPSTAEWSQLLYFVDGTSGTSSRYSSSTAGKYLRATSGWYYNNGQDTYGFTALPGGYCIGGDNGCSAEEMFGYWWTSTFHHMENNGAENFSHTTTRHMIDGFLNGDGSYSPEHYMYSVRCVKN
jgi:uncharacterized protein (TIGR02145 family)